jgi:hypothetical protein
MLDFNNTYHLQQMEHPLDSKKGIKFAFIMFLTLVIGVLMGTITGVLVSLKISDARDQNALVTFKQNLISELDVNYQLLHSGTQLTEPLSTNAYMSGIATGQLNKLGPDIVTKTTAVYAEVAQVNQLISWHEEYKTISDYYDSKSGKDDPSNYYSSRAITFHEYADAFAIPPSAAILQASNSDVPDNMLGKIANSDVPDNMLSLLNALRASTGTNQ